ncbi:MAG: tRNA uridine-5-carboxymethylaminomethyl(34) synthesis GTPase MnmE, partial [Pseudomonadota bacterium]
MTDTIYALSSAPGKAGVAVVRVSGDKAFESFKLLINNNKVPKARDAQLVVLKDPNTKQTIDNALVL